MLQDRRRRSTHQVQSRFFSKRWRVFQGIVANAINGKLGVCEGTSTSCASDAVCGGGAGSCLLTSVLMNGQSIVSNAMDIVMLSQESLEIFDPPATGAGQTIGLVAFSSIQTSDIANWLALLGLPSSLLNQVSQVSVNGGAPLGPDESELLLGVETVLAVAPGAQVVVYDGPFTESRHEFADDYKRDDQRRRNDYQQ